MPVLLEFTIMVPYNDRHIIDNLEAPDFVITNSFKTRSRDSRVFIVRTTEETATFLALQYGSDRVWRR